MTDLPTIDQFDDDFLHELFDDGAVQRGRRYAAEGRVRLLGSEPGTVRAVCEGAGRAVYVVSLTWAADRNGTWLDDECSCPLGGQCKHCVATILTARAELATDPVHHLRLAPSPAWRKELAGLGTGPEPDRTPTAALALQLTVVQPPTHRYAYATTPSVRIRPVREGKNGRWVKGGASWRELTSPYPRVSATLDEAQITVLQSLAAAAHLGYYSTGAEPSLDQFGPSLWYHLARAQEVGVELVGPSPDVTVALATTPARPAADLSADEHGTLFLRADLVVDGSAVAPRGTQSEMVGSPAHGMWVAIPGQLVLVPFDRPLHPTVAHLVDIGPLAVPAADADELLDRYLPDLARHATVGSADGSVTIETNRFAGLILQVERTAVDAAELRWAARYRRGERVTDRPLHARSGAARDLAAEAEALASLKIPTHLLAGLASDDGSPRDLDVRGADAVTVFDHLVPWADADGSFRVEVSDRAEHPPLRAATGDPLISLKVHDSDRQRDGNDWFDLDVQVSIDDELVEFVPLFAALNRDDELLILPSGTWLRLDRPEFTKLRDLLQEARGLADPVVNGVARINRFQADWWAELASIGVVEEQSERWSRQIAQMDSLTTPEPVTPSPLLRAELRPYQQEGLDWLAFLHRNGLGGILADDMGLGKTVQTLALCLHVHEQQPTARTLVVAPTSVVENWAREAERFAPSLEVRTIRATENRRGTTLAQEVQGAHLVVTSYALFRIEFERYAEHDWDLLLLDEAQFVKNHQGKTYQCARRLDAATKIAITGTPLENTLMDLWALLSITAPGLYPDPKRFSDTYRRPIENGTAPELLATLRRRIAPLMRRRTKDAVLTELPPKIEQTIEIELSAKHARIYATQLQRQRQKVLGLVGDVTRHRFEILKSLTLLRQLALDPGLVDDDHDAVGSAKLDRLVEDLTQVVAEGHRALVFSQFTRFLRRARQRLDDAGIPTTYLDGRTRKRDDAIARFKDGDCPVFLISLKAGGFGLNLTEADYCFVLDPWWNPATETQAVDRAHRIGQRSQVVVYRYVSTSTIEEKVMELKARKANLFDSVVGDEATLAGALSEDDIRSLLDLA